MNTLTPTATPRTDAATYPADCLGKTLVTNRDCSRELERELATERARLDHVLKNDCAWNDRSEIDQDIKNMSAESKK